MKLIEKIKNKIPEKHKKRATGVMRVINVIRKVIFWTFIVVLVFTVLSFLVVRINGGTPSVFGYTIQRVSSGSMEPTLKVGDIIISKDVEDITELEAGDIITFKGDKTYDFNNVTHRILIPPAEDYDGTYYITTRGDANDASDEPITGDKVMSKYIGKIDILQKFYEFFLSPWGLITFVGLLLLIFFDEIINIVRIVTGNVKDEDDEEEESISQIIERIKREEAEAKLAQSAAEAEKDATAEEKHSKKAKKDSAKSQGKKSDHKKKSEKKSESKISKNNKNSKSNNKKENYSKGKNSQSKNAKNKKGGKTSNKNTNNVNANNKKPQNKNKKNGKRKKR